MLAASRPVGKFSWRAPAAVAPVAAPNVARLLPRRDSVGPIRLSRVGHLRGLPVRPTVVR